MDTINVTAVEADWMGALCSTVLKAEEIIGHLWGASHFTGTMQTQDEQVHHEPIILHNEGSKLQASDNAVRIGVVHVLQSDNKKLLKSGRNKTNKCTIQLQYL